MPGNLFQDLTVRVATDAPQPARESKVHPGREREPGVRLVDGELQYSDEWLDAEAAVDLPSTGALAAISEDVDRGP
jgi:hypothetical protein